MPVQPTLPLVFGGGSFGQGMYQDEKDVCVANAVAVLRTAFDNGVRAIDTSPWYHPSEYIIGEALSKLSRDFPRESYRLVTKCGRYQSVDGGMFQYTPDVLRWSIERSLKLLKTDYLDVVYLHDVEFVAETVGKSNAAGCPTSALDPELAAQYGLGDGQAGKALGAGDTVFLEAIKTLQEFKSKGVIKKIGISGYPLATLLRLAILVRTQLHAPLDIILSYGTHGLRMIEPGQSESNLERFLPHFIQRAGVLSFMAASPLEMGLLADPPHWHPAPQQLKDELAALREQVDLTAIALRYATRPLMVKNHQGIAIDVVVGWTSPEEVISSLKAYARSLENRSEDFEEEQAVVRKLQAFDPYSAGWMWQSGRQDSAP